MGKIRDAYFLGTSTTALRLSTEAYMLGRLVAFATSALIAKLSDYHLTP